MHVHLDGRCFTRSDMAGGVFYHGSTRDLTVGTVLVPGHGTNFLESPGDCVSITSDYGTALYWARLTGGGGRVYVVEPRGEVTVWRAGLAKCGTRFQLWEGRVPSARIIEVATDAAMC